MIIGNIKNAKEIPLVSLPKIASFLQFVNVDTPDGKYELDGDKIYAKVQTYTTICRADCCIEAHNEYIDIQMIIDGEENIDVFLRETLETKNPYSKTNDVILFKDAPFQYSVTLNSGSFAVILPHEAHRSQVSVNIPVTVKKCVVKVHKLLFESY